MNYSTLLTGLALVSLLSFTEAADSCYADDNNPYLDFATKTAYEHAYNKKGISAIPDCKAQQLWLVSRHGTRWPPPDDVSEFEQLNQIKNHVISKYNANKGTLCQKDIENLKAWHTQLSPDQGNLLTKQGRQDLYFLGRRIRSYFPELLANASYSAEQFVFRHTDTPRTKESAEYFYRGVFGLNFEDPLPGELPPAIADDRLIYPYNNCPQWDALSSQSKMERAKFYKSGYMDSVVHNVSRRLGFDYNLTIDNVKNIYDGCRYQKAWNVTGISPWCAAFSKDDLLTMEYSEDLKYYYKSGPGIDMNLKLACPLVKDMYNQFSEIEAQPDASHPLALFYFSHASMVNMLSARLGLTNSMAPTANNFPEQQNRDYLSSHVIPFSGNILAVLYRCERGEPYQTVFYQTEQIVRYPGCSVGLCTWNYIKDRFSSFLSDSSCTDTAFCFNKNGAQLVTAQVSVIFVITAFLLSRLH